MIWRLEDKKIEVRIIKWYYVYFIYGLNILENFYFIF